MQPLITIITPFYNVSRYFDRSARSILGQTYPEIEFIFVDDGSPDDCAEQLAALLDGPFRERKERVRLVSRENGGLPSARRVGMEHARGAYILHVDSDDWMEPDMAERMVKAALETGSDLVYCDYFKEYADKTRIGREHAYRDRRTLLKYLIAGKHIRGYHWNKLVKSDLYRDHDLAQPVVNIREDLVITYQLFYYAEKVFHLAVPLYHYRRDNDASMMHGNRREQTRQCAINQMVLYDHYRHAPEPNPISVLHDDFLLRTGWYTYKSQSWDLLEQYLYFKEELFAIRPALRHDLWLNRQLRMRSGISALSAK